MAENNVGRPHSIDDLTLKKLEDAFSNGATDREACFLANISQQTLYNYQKEHPEFIERKESLKDMIKFQAKRVIATAIEQGDKAQANWWLERKGKDEGFNSRTELTGKDGDTLMPEQVLVKFITSDEQATDNNSNTDRIQETV